MNKIANPTTITQTTERAKYQEVRDKLVQENQGKMNQALNQVGVLEAQKYGLLGYVQQLNKEVEDNKKVLEEKYGAVSINLEDGSYTEITEEVK